MVQSSPSREVVQPLVEVVANPGMDGQDKWITYLVSRNKARREFLLRSALTAWDVATCGAIAATLSILIIPSFNYHSTQWFQSISWFHCTNECVEPSTPGVSTEFTGSPLDGIALNDLVVTSPFGWRTIFGQQDFHAGIDIDASGGDRVLAIQGGVIEEVRQIVDQWQVAIKVSDTDVDYYIHLDKPDIEVGDRIETGQFIGSVASTSQAAKDAQLSTGDHLDYRRYRNGEPINPSAFLSEGETK